MNLAILHAIELAALAHHGVDRKYCKEPYLMHPLRVLKLVTTYLLTSPSAIQFTNLRERMQIDAVLHDVIEDTEDTAKKNNTKHYNDAIGTIFGEDILSDCWWLTNVTKKTRDNLKFGTPIIKGNRAFRVKENREHACKAPHHVRIVKIYDRKANLEDVKRGDAKGVEFTRSTYLNESKELYIGMKNVGTDPGVLYDLANEIDIAQAFCDNYKEKP